MNEVTERLRAHVTSRDYHSDAHTVIRVNHLGFLPKAPKVAVLEAEGEHIFRLVCCETGAVADEKTVFSEKLDFGTVAQYDFSSVTTPGTYYITAGIYRSYPVRVFEGALDEAFIHPVTYFAAQRCGPSATGYHTPCHVEDGIRMDNGERRDVTGGWHDASDLRKWVSATLYGMLGLAKVYELQGDVTRPGAILEELKWGNRYFLAMQEDEGYVMAHCGGDVFAHSDSNHWTDNLRGTEDDRVIKTTPEGLAGQLRFVAAQAVAARVAGSQGDGAYAKVCLKAGARCFSWCLVKIGDDTDLQALGDGLIAALEMFRSTGDALYADWAADFAGRIKALQVTDYEPVRGFFRMSKVNAAPYKDIHGDPVGIGLCLALKTLGDHPDAPAWRTCLRMWAMEYILPMVKRGGYGMSPYGLYEHDAGGGRKIGGYFFRYFMGLHDRMETDGTAWWVGINAHVAAIGIALAEASQLLGEPELMVAAQRQLDWILGANPLDESTVDLVGRNHHTMFDPHCFVPPTPRIRGAVLNGIGGGEDDMPHMHDGSYHTCEYWTPMVCHTMWLAALLKKLLA